jgi:cellulose synthase operon protein C
LAPNNPMVLDIAGWLLVQRGQVEAGLRHLRDARLREPANGMIRYHLATALSKAGKRNEARDELSAALASGAQVGDPADVARLRAELGL